MRNGRLRRRRSRAQRTVLASVGTLVFVISGVAAGLAAYLSAATDIGVRTTLDASLPDEAAVQVTLQGGDDSLAEHSAVTEHLDQLLADVPHRLYRSHAAGPTPVDAGADEITRALLTAYDDLPGHAELVDGAWPDQVASVDVLPVAVHAGPATELDLGVGDRLSVVRGSDVVTMQITGLYRPDDPRSAYWYAQPREVDGSASGTDLLVSMHEADLVRASAGGIRTRYRLVTDVGHLDRSGVETLGAALTRLDRRLSGDARLAGSRIGIDDELSPVLRETDDRLRAARSVAVVPLVLLGVSCAIALALVAKLLAITRETETVLLRARGASSGLLGRWAAREAVPVVLLPAAAGGVMAWLLLRPLPEVGSLLSTPALVGGAVTAALLAMVILTVAGASAARVARHATAARAGGSRRQAVLRAGTVPLLVAVAAVSLWQLRRYGAPTVADAAGTSRTDPLAVAAPAAGLLAGGALAAVLVAGLAWTAGRSVAGRRGLIAAFAVRHVSRRPAAYALPVVLLVTAAGGGTLAGGFAATWAGLQSDAAALRTGAGLQVVLRDGPPPLVTPGSDEVDLAAYRDVAGIERVHPGVAIPGVATADGTVELLARPSATGSAPAGVELPTQARSVEVVLEAAVRGALDEERFALEGMDPGELRRPAPAPVRAQLWVADADGVVSLLAPDPVEVPADGRRSLYQVRSRLPAGAPPWTVIGLDLQVSPPRPDRFVFAPWIYDYDIGVAELRTDSGRTELGPDDAWSVVRLDPDIDLGFGNESGSDRVTAEPLAPGLGLRVDSGGLAWSGQVSTRIAADDGAARPLPVAATARALERFGLAVGDRASLRVLGSDVPVEVVESVSTVPGTTAADVVVADLRELTTSLLVRGGGLPVVNRVWADATAEALEDGSAASGVAGVAGPQARVLDRAALERELRTNVFAGLSVVTFWVTSGVLVLLAVVGLATAAAAIARQRGADVAVLRAVGVSPGQQGLTRLVEQAFIAVLAVGLGAGAGWLLTSQTAGLLGGAATPSPVENLEPAVRLPAGPWVGVLLALVLLSLLVAAAHGGRVRRQASRMGAGEVGA